MLRKTVVPPIILTASLAFFLAVSFASLATAAEPHQWAEQHVDQLMQLYKYFHSHPELSLHEEQTSKRLADELRSLGYKVEQNVGGFGVVAVLENGTGPTVMLRTDLDALPVVERTPLDFKSTVHVKDDRGATVGVMHACGHDLHMTNLIGGAQYMAEHKDQWQGTLMLIGQPAEEKGQGAGAMLKDGLFTRFPKPDYALALHDDAALATGKVSYRPGYSQANVDSVDITIKGRGGHGAYPQTTIDPIVIAARLILDLQTIVSREIKPIEPAVITVGSIHGGTKHNIIDDTCHLQLTVRSYSDDVRQQLLEGIKRKAKAAAASAGAPEPEVTVSEGTPSLYNDEKLVDRIVPALQAALGKDNVTEAEPSMGGEDFSRFGKAGVPIMMFRLGAVSPARLADYAKQGVPPPSLHSPLFYPDAREALTTGITAMTAAALELLKPPTPAEAQTSR